MQIQLKRLRKERGLLQEDLARLAGIKKRAYGGYERGEIALSLQLAARLADVLECTLDELAGREWPQPTYIDPRQAEINEAYMASDEQARASILDGAQNALAASKGREDEAPRSPDLGVAGVA